MLTNAENILDFSALKELKNQRKLKGQYKKILGTYSNAELTGEVDDIINQVKDGKFSKDQSYKIKIIMKELANRCDNEQSIVINQLLDQLKILHSKIH